jgi:hypothetical protein
MQCALRRADRLDRWRSAIRRSRNCGPHEIEGTPVSASQPTSRSCSSMMACVSRIEGRLSNDVLCLLQRMSLYMALRDISLRCAIWSLSGHSGLWPAARPVVYGFTALINLCLVLWFGPQRCKSRNAHLRDFLEQQFHIFFDKLAGVAAGRSRSAPSPVRSLLYPRAPFLRRLQAHIEKPRYEVEVALF